MAIDGVKIILYNNLICGGISESNSEAAEKFFRRRIFGMWCQRWRCLVSLYFNIVVRSQIYGEDNYY